MKYCLDANIFIQAKNLYYHFDICPGFWDWLDQQAGTVISILPICEELESGDDRLKEWAAARKKSIFFADVTDMAVQEAFRKIAAHVVEEYEPQHAAKFLDGADPWLIAFAQVHGCTVVTGERFSPGARKVKIPNICEQFGVHSTDSFTMLRSLSACFILDS
jgi:hypothetical protein